MYILVYFSMARILGVCVLIMLACVFWKAQGDDSCEMRDMGKAVALIVQVKNNVEILQKTVSSQQRTIQKMKKSEETMNEMERTMETMKRKEEEMERTVETMKQSEDEMKRTMETMKQSEEEMKRTMDALKNNNAMVGFSVNYPKDVSGGVLTFSKTVTNVGNGYDMDTGIFTCTTPGMFYFSVSLLKAWSHRSSTWCLIRKNSDDLVYAYTDPSRSHDSRTAAVASVLVHLAVGDKVKLAGCTPMNTFHGGNASTFSGFLVAPDA